jgi:hypothetical protein
MARGRNDFGQSTAPAGLSAVSAIAAGASHSIALKSDGTVVCWGKNDVGQSTPPAGLTGVKAVAAGTTHSLALKADGTVVGWGDNTHGETAMPTGLSGVVAVAAGQYFSCALKSDGTVVCWGDNTENQTIVPSGLSGVVGISAGSSHAIALKSDGTLACWGRNTEGQTSPPSNLSAIAISAGGSHCLAIASSGAVVGWGLNDNSQATAPSSANRVTITATATDFAGNTGSASVSLNRSSDAGGNLNNAVQLTATPVGGFAPLQVTFQVQSSAPGSLQHVYYDFDGDGVSDQTANDLAQLSHTYSSPGQFFPVVTVETSLGRFSSPGGWSSSDPSRLRINVQSPPVILQTINVTDPVDLKWMPGGFLYVLSGSTATLTEFDSSGTAIRTLSGMGSSPQGLDVDSAGNVYVAVTGNNEVEKLNPTETSFRLDLSFNGSGKIGRADGSAGAGAGEFNAPYDVAASDDVRRS